MPKRTNAQKKSEGSGKRSASTSQPLDPFAGLAERVQQIAAPNKPLVDLSAALKRMEVENARLGEAKALLRTAAEFLHDGRDGDARTTVAEALRFEPIDHGEINCAGMAAHIMIGDAIEKQAAAAEDEEDGAWLEGILALVPRFTGPEADHVRLALSSVNDYALPPAEQARVDAVFGSERNDGSPLETVAGHSERVEVLVSLLRVLRELEAAAGH